MKNMGVTDNRRCNDDTVTNRNALAKQTGRTGEPCVKCGRELCADEVAVVRGWVHRVSLHPYPYMTPFVKDSGVMCVECTGLRRAWGDIWRYYSREGDPSDFYCQERACGGCGRPTVMWLASSRRIHTFCCYPCEVAYHNRRRRVPKRAKTCEVCGEEFTAKRVDTKTCSPACKQKGYRQRVKEMEVTIHADE